MAQMKCLSCGTVFEEKKENKKIKVTLSNPGDVFFEGSISTCPTCKEEYVEGGADMINLAAAFDKEHARKHEDYHKKVKA